VINAGVPPTLTLHFLIDSQNCTIPAALDLTVNLLEFGIASSYNLTGQFEGNHVALIANNQIEVAQNVHIGVGVETEPAGNQHYYNLLTGFEGEQNPLRVCSFDRVDERHLTNMQTGGIHSPLGPEQPADGDISGDNGFYSLLMLTRYPDQSLFRYIRHQINPPLPLAVNAESVDMVEFIVLAQEQMLLGARRIGLIAQVREPIMCGPLQPFGYITSPRRPFRDTPKFLPPRLSTYTLHYPLENTTISDFNLVTRGDVALCVEYVAAPLDPVERNYMCAPSYEHILFTFTEPGKQRFEVHNGIPSFFILESSPQVEEFDFHLNGRSAPALRSSTHHWDHFKMTARAMHPLAIPQHTATTDFGGVAILKLEEIGLFGMMAEEKSYMNLDFEVRSGDFPTNVRLTLVYDNRILDERDEIQKLRYIV
jgi:hypothetical protein